MDKRRRRKQGNGSGVDNAWKPNSDEIDVATYMYRKLPAKEARLSGMVVRVFVAEDAVSLLMESPWSVESNTTNSKKAKPCFFSTRDSTISFLTTLLQKQMFHRAVKIVRSKMSHKKREEPKAAVGKSAVKKLSSDAKPLPDKNPSALTAQPGSKVENETSRASNTVDKRNQLSSQSATDESNRSAAAPTIANHTSKENTTKSSSASTKPMKIEISDRQLFILDDPETVYVWIYEPPPGLFNWLAGSALLIGIIICCLFPIWPTELRSGAYYLTLLASALFGILLAVALLRLVLYLLFWVCTLGKYGFWLFPNYFEDCGFFESFRPVYSCTLITSDGVETKRLKSRSKSSGTGLTDTSKCNFESPSKNGLSKTNQGKRKKDLAKID